MRVPGMPYEPAKEGNSKVGGKPKGEQFRALMQVGESEKRQKKKRRQAEEKREAPEELSCDKPTKSGKEALAFVSTGNRKRPQRLSAVTPSVIPASTPSLSEAPPTETVDLLPANGPEKSNPEVARPPPARVPPKKPALTSPPPLPIPEEQGRALSQKIGAQELPKPPSLRRRGEPIPPPPDPPPAPPGQLLLLSTATALAPPHLDSDILELFERMVSLMQVMEEAGIRETVISLSDLLGLEGSCFAGGQIVIREVDTAPLAYTLEFHGSPESTERFRKSIPRLFAAFKKGGYRFQVTRIEAFLLA